MSQPVAKQVQHSPGPADSSIDAVAELLERLQRTSRSLRRALAARVQPCGLSEIQYLLLRRCAGAPASGISQRQLAHVLAVSPAQISGLLEQLRKQQLVVGIRPPSDRRRQVWELTDQGHKLLAAVEVPLQNWSATVLNDFDRQEFQQLVHALDRLDAADASTAMPPVADAHPAVDYRSAENPCSPDRRGAA